MSEASKDAWSSLQAQGVSASDAPPPGASIVYTDVGAYGRQIVGFQLGLDLPDMCFKCAKSPAETRVGLRITAQRDLVWRLAAAGGGRRDWLSAPSKEKFHFCFRTARSAPAAVPSPAKSGC
jgi:hypothetical protein